MWITMKILKTKSNDTECAWILRSIMTEWKSIAPLSEETIQWVKEDLTTDSRMWWNLDTAFSVEKTTIDYTELAHLLF